MKNRILTLFLGIFLSSAAISQEYMKVSAIPVITEKNQQCLQIRPGYSRKDTARWVPYCGILENFRYEQGYEYTLYVKKYDPRAETIQVIKIIGRDNSDSYRKQQELKRKREAPDLGAEQANL